MNSLLRRRNKLYGKLPQVYHGGEVSGQHLASISSKLPAPGAELISKHGIEWVVDGHINTNSIANKHGEKSELTYYPVIFPQNMSPRFDEFLNEVSRCTPKVIVPVDTMPTLFPNRAHNDGHWIDAWSDPEHILIFLDAANTSEAVLAHELAHAWIDLVRDIEDYRVWRDREDSPRYRQIQTLQSFVLDVAVDQVLKGKGFDHGVIDCDNEIASMQLRVAAERGYQPENLREGLFIASHLATALIQESESNAIAKMIDVMPVVRRNLPELHALAEGMATAVLDSMPTDRASTTKAIDEVLQLAFAHTDPGLHYNEQLITVQPAVNWEMEKNKGWLTGQTPRGKCEIGVAMARLGATTEDTPALQQLDDVPVTVRFIRPDGTETEKVPMEHVRMPEDPRITNANEMMEEVRKNKKRIEEMKNMNKPQSPKSPGMPQVGPQLPNIPGLNFPPRTYSAGTARWITQVRMEQMLAGEHPYNYANCNPIAFVDPLGLAPCSPAPPSPCATFPGTPCDYAKSIKDVRGDDGGIVCCDGVMWICDWNKSPYPGVHTCIVQHENLHKPWIDCPPTGYKRGGLPPEDYVIAECIAYARSFSCFREQRQKDCGKLTGSARKACEKEYHDWICAICKKLKALNCPSPPKDCKYCP
jgi:hypothetical protein